MALRIPLAILLLSTAVLAAEQDELGTVVLVGCGSLGQSHIHVKWDSGKTNIGAYCPPAGFPIGFAKGDRVKKENGVLVKMGGSALPTSTPSKPPPTSTVPRGTVTGITVSVKMDDGTTREIHLPAGTAPSIGATVEVTGTSLRPVER